MPTKAEIDELTAFLPLLCSEDFSPVKGWKRGERTESGAITMPWPDYDQVVRDFFKAASASCWMDGRYLECEAGDMLEDEEIVGNASLDLQTNVDSHIREKARILRISCGAQCDICGIGRVSRQN